MRNTQKGYFIDEVNEKHDELIKFISMHPMQIINHIYRIKKYPKWCFFNDEYNRLVTAKINKEGDIPRREWLNVVNIKCNVEVPLGRYSFGFADATINVDPAMFILIEAKTYITNPIEIVKQFNFYENQLENRITDKVLLLYAEEFSKGSIRYKNNWSDCSEVGLKEGDWEFIENNGIKILTYCKLGDTNNNWPKDLRIFAEGEN